MSVLCRPRLKYWMDYCQDHPDEMNKVASVQRKVSASQRCPQKTPLFLRRASRLAVLRTVHNPHVATLSPAKHRVIADCLPCSIHLALHASTLQFNIDACALCERHRSVNLMRVDRWTR